MQGRAETPKRSQLTDDIAGAAITNQRTDSRSTVHRKMWSWQSSPEPQKTQWPCAWKRRLVDQPVSQAITSAQRVAHGILASAAMVCCWRAAQERKKKRPPRPPAPSGPSGAARPQHYPPAGRRRKQCRMRVWKPALPSGSHPSGGLHAHSAAADASTIAVDVTCRELRSCRRPTLSSLMARRSLAAKSVQPGALQIAVRTSVAE